MRFPLNLLFLLLSVSTSYAQTYISGILEKCTNNAIEYVSTKELSSMKKAVLLDAGEKEEFEVYHLKNAIWIGYESLEIVRVMKSIQDKNPALVVSCFIGVTFEDVDEKLKDAGYTDIKNLYGGIFEWRNNGYPVYNTDNMET